MPTWPASLPQSPLQRDYNETLPNLTITTQMDQGPAKVRRRFTAGVTKYQFSFLMNATQLTAFNTFFTSDISSGALAFDFPDPRSGSTESFRIDMDQGPPAIIPNSGNQYIVSFAAEKLP